MPDHAADDGNRPRQRHERVGARSWIVIAGDENDAADKVRMVQCEFQRHDRTVRVAKDHGPLDPDSRECVAQQVSLLFGAPCRTKRPIAVGCSRSAFLALRIL